MVFKKIIFQNSLMANETPSRPPPPPGKCHLKFPFWLFAHFPNGHACFRYHWLCVGINSEPSENQDWFCTRCMAKKQVKHQNRNIFENNRNALRDCTWTKLLRFIQNSEGNSRQTSFCLPSMFSHSSSLYLSWLSVHTWRLKWITGIVCLNIARTWAGFLLSRNRTDRSSS